MSRANSVHICLFLLAGAFLAAPATADTITVCCHGTGDFETIQEGIDAAVNGDTVLVLDGTYDGDGNRDLDFGGRLITVRSENGPDNCIIDCQASDVDQHRAFHFHSGETTAACVEGFTILNGHQVRGGAIRCVEAGATVDNCVFGTNTADGGFADFTGSGGAVYCRYADLVLADCEFIQNTAIATGRFRGYGGAVLCRESTLTVSNCLFLENTAHEVSTASSAWGGAVGCIEQSYVLVGNCTFVGNHADQGGGGIALGSSTTVVTECRFVENTAHFGGGLWADGNQYGSADTLLANCVFAGNRARPVSGYWNLPNLGGAISSVANDTMVMSNCMLVGNTARYGGGLDVGRALTMPANCTIVGNMAEIQGGGIVNEIIAGAGVCELSNSIMWGNVPNQIETVPPATTIASYSCIQEGCAGPGNISADPQCAGGSGGTWIVDGIYDTDEGKTTFTDTAAAWDPNELSGMFLQPNTGLDPNDPNGYLQSLIVSNTATTLSVWGSFEFLGTAGASYQVNDYHLSIGSPCIDAGCNCGVPPDAVDLDDDGDIDEPTPLDLDGEGRFFDDPNTPDNGSGWPPIVDMGAYESGGTGPQPCLGDLDNDRDVDLGDLAALLSHYGSTSGMTQAEGDLDCDGDVELADLAALLSVYGTTCE
jgi:hypothetical protein